MKIFVVLALFLIVIGSIFVIWSFRSPNIKNNLLRLIRIGEVGVIFSLIGGLMLIRYYYGEQAVSERILKEHLEEKYREEDADIS